MLIYILFFILIILILLPTILLSLITSILSFFSFRMRKGTPRNGNSGRNETSYTDNNAKKETRKDGRRKKIFDKDDGEYVDFEEIK